MSTDLMRRRQNSPQQQAALGSDQMLESELRNEIGELSLRFQNVKKKRRQEKALFREQITQLKVQLKQAQDQGNDHPPSRKEKSRGQGASLQVLWSKGAVCV